MIENIKAFVFDMDGTLVKSGLNFDQMRADLGFPEKVPILEYLDTLDDKNRIKKSHEIIHEHELAGANRATLFSGVSELLQHLKDQRVPLGLLTRNSTEVTEITLKKFGLEFDIVFTRDNCEPKPKPDGILKMASSWNLPPEKLIYIGDYLFDIQTARNANSIAGLFINDRNKEFKDKADILIHNYSSFLNDLTSCQ